VIRSLALLVGAAEQCAASAERDPAAHCEICAVPGVDPSILGFSRMLLSIIPHNAADPEQVDVYEGERKVGHIFKSEKEWIWGVDWFCVGLKLARELKSTGMLKSPDIMFKHYWEWVVRSGVENRGRGHAPTRDQAMAEFEAVWGYVTKAASGNSQQVERGRQLTRPPPRRGDLIGS
jgi:hypothetical protein